MPRTGARFSVNMLSAVSAQGDLRFMVHEGTATAATAATFCAFLERLVTGMERPIFLVVDGHRIHRAKKVQRPVVQLDGKLKLFLLPPYSPQLNPDEWVLNNVKQRVAKTFITTREQLIASARSVLHSLQRTQSKIIGFFRDPDCHYAAA
ncbi:transposase (fragment) [Thiocapsa sp. KS1]